MNENPAPNEKKKRAVAVDRITLRPDSLNRLDGWLASLQVKFRGIRVSRSDLVNWLIGARAPELSGAELRALQREYFDEVQFTAWALRELKDARARGEKLSLKDIMARDRASQKPAHDRPPKTKEKSESQ